MKKFKLDMHGETYTYFTNEHNAHAAYFGHPEAEVKPGDYYIAEKNTGPHLFCCAFVHESGFIVSTRIDKYPYDLSDCYKIIETNDPRNIII